MVIVSPTETGSMNWVDCSIRMVPGPGNCVPSVVAIKEALHMPWAMTFLNVPLLANSRSTMAGLMSPDMMANN